MEQQLKLYPNPVATTLNLELPVGVSSTEVKVMNAPGQVVYNQEVPAGVSNLVIPVEGMSNGIYFMKIQQADYQVTRKFIVHQRP